MKNAIIVAVIAAAGLAGCTKPSQPETGPLITMNGTSQPGGAVATMTSPDCRLPQDRPGNYQYSGGHGDRLETAIVMEGNLNEMTGVDAEYAYVARHLPGWGVCGQALLNPGRRAYDQLDLMNAAGQRRSVFFDITDWIGKGITR
jgi:hypothetical protein